MKATSLNVVATMAALLAPTTIVWAQDVQFPKLTNPNPLVDPNSLVTSPQDRGPVRTYEARPYTLGGNYASVNPAARCAQSPLQATAALLFLQPGSGSLEYGTLVSPLPAASPHWENQSITPKFSPAFNFGLRYFVPSSSNDIHTSWTHLSSTDSASFVGGPGQFAGPSYLIGPGANAYNIGRGSVTFRYDAVNIEAGHQWGAGSPFQLRVHGGVQYANITQNLTGSFSDYAGTNTQTDTTASNFSGAGPRFGVNAQFNRRQFQILGDMALIALIGTQRSRMDFLTTSPALANNAQSFTSPNATQIVPGLDSRLGGSYCFPLGNGCFKIEAGYRAVAYVNAINSYSLTQVTTPTTVSSVGVFFATAQHVQNTFTAHGPYLQGTWAF
ncbi:MAG TPA: Lpg1974 family pore-forming outer membrane protein [Pirellulales bacterium]|nr:Lpg1974 family pore-forming outer membrane protein [Pirellulales bacterium]